MAKNPRTPKPKKPGADAESKIFEDVARKIFKVPKSEVDPKAKKS